MITDKERLAKELLDIPLKYLRVRDLMWIEKNCDTSRVGYHLNHQNFLKIGNDILNQVNGFREEDAVAVDPEVIEDKSLFGQIFGPSHRRAKI